MLRSQVREPQISPNVVFLSKHTDLPCVIAYQPEGSRKLLNIWLSEYVPYIVFSLVVTLQYNVYAVLVSTHILPLPSSISSTSIIAPENASLNV